MKTVSRILIGMAISITSVISSAEDLIVVEWAPFVKASGITDQNLIKAASKVNAEFLSIQPGFIKRELVKKSETDYADIVYWSTRENAVAAGNKVEKCAVCVEYFALMNMKASEKSGAGFSYYSIIKTW
ncbi:MAG: hypothetical protein JKY24_02950 [Pseudomonadales bacterium]|nr:hypothetical protein [Pseudomonadales bacterium]